MGQAIRNKFVRIQCWNTEGKCLSTQIIFVYCTKTDFMCNQDSNIKHPTPVPVNVKESFVHQIGRFTKFWTKLKFFWFRTETTEFHKKLTIDVNVMSVFQIRLHDATYIILTITQSFQNNLWWRKSTPLCLFTTNCFLLFSSFLGE